MMMAMTMTMMCDSGGGGGELGRRVSVCAHL
jgi:hypothetical protein